MGESGYAENFVNLMLGWIRQLSSAIAGLFRSNGSAQSGGRALLDWFSGNWITLLIVLIVVGVVADWLVWMFRWRPYWLWFRKRRVILDDDIDEELSEDEMLDRYGLADEAPRFHSHALPREDAPYEADAYEAYEDGEDEDEEGYEAYVQDEDDAPYEDEPEADDALPDAPEDDDWDDLPPKHPPKRLLFGRKRREEEDPFAVDDEAFHGVDDDFFEVVSENPHPEADEDLRIYARPDGGAQVGLAPLREGDARADDYDERIGYEGSAEPLAGTAHSRKSRREKLEGHDD